MSSHTKRKGYFAEIRINVFNECFRCNSSQNRLNVQETCGSVQEEYAFGRSSGVILSRTVTTTRENQTYRMRPTALTERATKTNSAAKMVNVLTPGGAVLLTRIRINKVVWINHILRIAVILSVWTELSSAHDPIVYQNPSSVTGTLTALSPGQMKRKPHAVSFWTHFLSIFDVHSYFCL